MVAIIRTETDHGRVWPACHHDPMSSANIIRHDVHGLMVSPHDVDGLAQAISSVANLRESRNRLARQVISTLSKHLERLCGRFKLYS
jgi:hypothetical protein